MADTYSQLYAQIVFAPQGRQNLIPNSIKVEVYKYMSGIIKNKKQKPMIINGMPDHVHLFIGFNPDIALSDLVRDIKSNTTSFINEKKLIKGKFNWQRGFGAFTYSKSQIPNDVMYIKNQEEHHRRKSFREEYIELLEKFEVDYNPQYLFEWIEK